MYKKTSADKRGFTLIELIVSAGIISVVMLSVMFNTRRFNDGISLKTTAQNISLALRQAQTFGTSVKESSSGTGSFSSGYGLWFDKSNPNTVFMFVDLNSNGRFDGSTACGGNDECRESIPLRNGVTVQTVCGIYGAAVTDCFDANMRSMFVTFLRPNADARFQFVNNAGTADVRTFYAGYVVLQSQQGSTIQVYVDTTGQISVR